ncbi:MAG: non-canonical purine NTP pyrophosphatase, partial [Candidatus Dormibacteraeota bacterium]|nr:non-canonical purine NTP pyrophosphatase [Candidatus Dormibacteraeota bacterium]
DDSGLEVDALGGLPGLRSARVAPTQAERNRLLLERLRDVARPWQAQFTCALALVRPDAWPVVVEGVRAGVLVEPRAMGGFGYDPLFLVPEVGRTFAEMDGFEKNRWSHRGAAVRALLERGPF